MYIVVTSINSKKRDRFICIPIDTIIYISESDDYKAAIILCDETQIETEEKFQDVIKALCGRKKINFTCKTKPYLTIIDGK